MKTLGSEEKKFLMESIRDVPDFPKPGILFKDITTLLNNPKAYNLLMEHLSERYAGMDLDYVAGIESRGFIFGAALAAKLGIGFVPVRKRGKLPYTTIGEKYALEYGVDEIEIHIDAFNNREGARVLLIDDLIATGGTAEAAAKLIKDARAECVEACFIINLTFLNGAEKLKGLAPVYHVLEVV
ncbi:adenine phosphoribosyltransferase [Hydrogenimonas urashimensis]|uniref:adenine phosphoribosyltransferase n=1 Tax=Hydrogenimonas urashimensis TaxID=2740515 RepID=UPI0019163CA2|nr:adenine phosphoribosyltransferase [Hydrogenimonas urashimensis]